MGRAEAEHELVQSLFKAQKKHGKLVRSTVYDAPEDPEIKVRSWKMSEHHYYKVPSPFPTLARGIFTTWVSNGHDKQEGQGTGSYRIVARGYDKFFNIGEVPWTTWDAISRHTSPPYTLSVKSNGCIIFIAALTSSKLLVTSKHSIGAIQGQEMSHSQAGDKWLHKHLASVGKERSDLAKVLWDNGWTAVAELCDDSFEEHVLPYTPENTGLHLHGINRSTARFETLPSSASDERVSVESFAKEWGFIPTKSFDLQSAQEVKEFADSCAETGSWNGEPLEGFVVRTHVSGSGAANLGRSDSPPYSPGSSFFFKVKFDEPYMMYRDWREITRTYLSAFSKNGAMALKLSKASKQRLKRPETRVYDCWVRAAIQENTNLFSGYQHGQGIIASRQKFLTWLASPEGQAHLSKEKGEKSRPPSPRDRVSASPEGKIIIVPVAIPGCGKTSVAIALAHLYGFGHTQSDDVAVKGKKSKTAPIFESNVRDLLQGNNFNVVIADKNNHLRQHRAALRRLLPNARPPIRLIALHWPIPELSKAEIHRICAKRIAARGENHQTLRASAESSSAHEEILWRFISTSEELSESEVDEIIEMDLHEDTESAVRRAASGLSKALQLEMPSQDAIREALRVSQGYVVPSGSKRAMTLLGKTVSREKSKGTPRYFGITPTEETGWPLNTIVNSALAGLADESGHKQLQNLWKAMSDGGRVTDHPHITLVHQASLKSATAADVRSLWDACNNSMEEVHLKFRLSHLIYNSRIMALVVDSDSILETSSQQPSNIMKSINPPTFERLHITVGTADRDVKPVEAGELILRWRKQNFNPDEGGVIPLADGEFLSGKVEGLWS